MNFETRDALFEGRDGSIETADGGFRREVSGFGWWDGGKRLRVEDCGSRVAG